MQAWEKRQTKETVPQGQRPPMLQNERGRLPQRIWYRTQGTMPIVSNGHSLVGSEGGEFSLLFVWCDLLHPMSASVCVVMNDVFMPL